MRPEEDRRRQPTDAEPEQGEEILIVVEGVLHSPPSAACTEIR